MIIVRFMMIALATYAAIAMMVCHVIGDVLGTSISVSAAIIFLALDSLLTLPKT